MPDEAQSWEELVRYKFHMTLEHFGPDGSNYEGLHNRLLHRAASNICGGITACTNTGQSVDSAKAKNAFRALEHEIRLLWKRAREILRFKNISQTCSVNPVSTVESEEPKKFL